MSYWYNLKLCVDQRCLLLFLLYFFFPNKFICNIQFIGFIWKFLIKASPMCKTAWLYNSPLLGSVFLHFGWDDPENLPRTGLEVKSWTQEQKTSQLERFAELRRFNLNGGSKGTLGRRSALRRCSAIPSHNFLQYLLFSLLAFQEKHM